MNRGILAGIGAFTLWGFFPIYWKLLQSLPAFELFAWRMISSFITLAFFLLFKKEFLSATKLLTSNGKQLKWLILSATMIGINWFLFIYATVNNQILSASLGYFISPIISVVLGHWLYKDSLNRLQKISFFLVNIAIALLIYQQGRLPFISLGLALSFALYGVLKKQAALPSLKSLYFESGWVSLLTFGYLLTLPEWGVVQLGPLELALLGLSGLVTILPLILFNIAARNISISYLGMLNYIAPCLQFVCGAYLYQEPVPPLELASFIIIWLAVILFILPRLLKKK